APVGRRTRQREHSRQRAPPADLRAAGREQELRVALARIEESRRKLAAAEALRDQSSRKLLARLGVKAQLSAALSGGAQDSRQADRSRTVWADRRPGREGAERAPPAHPSLNTSCDQLRERAASLCQIEDFASNHRQFGPLA